MTLEGNQLVSVRCFAIQRVVLVQVEAFSHAVGDALFYELAEVVSLLILDHIVEIDELWIGRAGRPFGHDLLCRVGDREKRDVIVDRFGSGAVVRSGQEIGKMVASTGFVFQLKPNSARRTRQRVRRPLVCILLAASSEPLRPK